MGFIGSVIKINTEILMRLFSLGLYHLFVTKSIENNYNYLSLIYCPDYLRFVSLDKAMYAGMVASVILPFFVSKFVIDRKEFASV